MKKLVVIGANDFQDQLVKKAKSLGYETHCFAWEEDAVAKDSADFFYPISIVEKEKILEVCKKIKPDGVCTIASDLAILTVDYVAEKLGLPSNSYQNTVIATNKFLMRNAFEKGGIDVPKFKSVTEVPDENDLKGFHYPLIVKPTDRSGSRCITKVTEFPQIKQAVLNAINVSFEKSAIIEEFIEGNEYSCECISQNGKHTFLAFTKKYTTGAPNFIETGHRQPSDIPIDLQPKIKDMIFKALDSLKIKNGASHSEFRIDANGNAKIIEIGPRMGGDCIGSDLVYLSTGYDFVKAVIDVAVGNEIEPKQNSANKDVEIRFLFSKEDIDIMNKFKESHPEKIYRMSQLALENLGNTEDSGSRVGYYIIY